MIEDSKPCSVKTYLMAARFEVFGAILIILATLLTLRTGDSFGIVMMFVTGFVLCCHHCFSKYCCCKNILTACSTEEGAHCDVELKSKKNTLPKS